MITFTIGLVMGFGLCWLRLRVVAKQLAVTTKSLNLMREAVQKSSVLLTKVSDYFTAAHKQETARLPTELLAMTKIPSSQVN